MKQDAARRYVLIPGGWHGGWVWQQVVTGLRAAGHEASALTLTGLGERRHLGGDVVDLETHVEDVVAHVEMEGLSDITLVGWSYGGMVATGALARIEDRIRSLIYLDAFVPEDGEANVDYVLPAMRAIWDEYRKSDTPLPPFSAEKLGLTDPGQIAFVDARLAPHPWRTLYQPVKALKQRSPIQMAYIRCSRNPSPPLDAMLEKMRKDPAVRTEVIDAGHSCMLTSPEETVRLLLICGA